MAQMRTATNRARLCSRAWQRIWAPPFARLGLTVVAAAALACSSPAVPGALADADPASDFLLVTSVFYPYQPPTSPTIKNALEKTLVQLKHAGLGMKVAIIGSANDLGGVPNLWKMPQPYAQYLGPEISFNRKQPLLVVMPQGFGLYGLRPRSALDGLAIESNGQADGLARTAIKAVVRLARANGKPIAEPTIGKVASAGKGAPALIVFGAPVLLVAAAALLMLSRRGHVEEDLEDV
jgi:hypothetical protein